MLRLIANLGVLAALIVLSVGCGDAATPGKAMQSGFTEPRNIVLAEAVAANDVEGVQAAIRAGGDVNARGEEGVGLLHWAILNRAPDALGALLDAGADPLVTTEAGRAAMHYAAVADDPAYLKVLLSRGASTEVRNSRNGHTPIFDAVGGRGAESLSLLIEAGADVNAAAPMGDTPLHEAASVGDFDGVKRLLEAGADPWARNAQKATFQAYLSIGPAESAYTEKAQRQREAIRNWLRAQRIEVDF